MATAQGPNDGRLCPNCGVGIPDTSVSYDEKREGGRFGTWGRKRFLYRTHIGRVWLCGPCAASYTRMAALRATGTTLMRRGAIALAVGLLLYALLYASLRTAAAPVQMLLAAPALAGVLTLLAGLAFSGLNRAMQGGATRFLHNPNLDKMAAPPTREAASAASSMPVSDEPRLTPEERRSLRARRRRRRRLVTAAVMVAGLVVLAAGIGGIALLVSNEAGLGHGGTQAYSVALSGNAPGWANDDSCGLHDGVYHVTPQPPKYGITCFAPAGAYTNFEASVTAALVSGAPNQPYGLAFRIVDPGNGYLFQIADGGVARVVLVKNGSLQPLSAQWPFPAGVSRVSGAQHTLTIRARGSSITCLVDGAQVGTLDDTTYARGTLGVFAGDPGMDVAFSGFSVTPA